MRRGKYNIAPKSKRTYKGEVYDSKAEMEYLKHLELMKKATPPSERVVSIDKQVKFPIEVEGMKICTYILDYKVTYADGSVKHIDVKGVVTPIYRLKKKLVKAVYGIDIIEITKDKKGWKEKA